MSDRTIYEDVCYILNGKSIAEVLKFFKDFPLTAKIVSGYRYDDFYMDVVLDETKEEKQARLAAEKAAKEAEKLEKRRQQYLKLKAEFEGESMS